MSTAFTLNVKRRFRFERLWLKLDGFLDEVARLWGTKL
jgi:hypothetical protein